MPERRQAVRWIHLEAAHGELQEASRAAEAASQTKSRFLATMGHELRTPLNSVIGFASVLLSRWDDLEDETGQDYVARIRRNGQHLLGLINSILDISKIEAGHPRPELELVRLEDLIQQTLEELDGPPSPHVELSSEVPANLRPLRADPAKLKQILINLVGNALKFTRRGRVLLRVHCAPDGVPSRIEIEDTGPGIPRGRLAAIFDAFEQVEAGSARTYQGTGLGLAISRSLAEQMGYRIDVQSELGSGTTFTLVLDGS